MSQLRHRNLFTVLTLIGSAVTASCGGSSPPTGGGTGAATVAVFAGSGQSVPAGQAAAIAPAVIVRDAEGRPFGGATVQFAVTSGGGSLEGASQVTDAAGVARVTRWTVGVAGPQRVTATVGSLAPVHFDATVGTPAGTITTSIPAGGGTVTISTAGHPYQGLSLTIPPGTFPSSVNWSMRVRTDLAIPTLPAGYRVGGSILEITTDAPQGGGLMTLDVPIQRPAGEGLVLAYYDPIRRVMEVLPTVGQSATSTRVVTTHLRADLLLGRSLPSLFAAFGAPPGTGNSIGALVPIVFSLPQAPVQSNFNAAVHQWPVVDYGMEDAPDGFSFILSALQVEASSTNTNLTTLIKPLAQPGFYADAGVMGSLIEGNALMQPVYPQLVAMDAQITAQSGSAADALTAQNITAQMALTGLPTIVTLYNASTGPVEGKAVAANPVSSSGSSHQMTRSFGAQSTLTRMTTTFESQSMDPQYRPAPTSTDRVLYTPGFLVPTAGVTKIMQQLKTLDALTGAPRDQMNDDIAQRAGMRKPTLELEAVSGGGWYPPEQQGPQAVRGANLSIRESGGTTDQTVYDLTSGQELTALGSQNVNFNPYLGPTKGVQRRIVRVRRSRVQNGRGPQPGYPTQVVLERARFRTLPDTVQLSADSSTVRFDADLPLPPSGGFRIRWDWGDGTSTTTSNSTTATHLYTPPGNYTVTSTLLSANGTVTLAADTAHVVSAASPHWRLTSMQNPDMLDLSVPIPLAMALQRAIGSPNSAMISVDAGLSAAEELSLRVKVNGTWNASNCCGAFSGPVAGELRELLGVAPSQAVAVGQVWQSQGYTSNQWSQSATDLGAGGISGQYLKGFYSYLFDASTVSGPARQTGPEYVLRISATRSGTAMSGTISFLYWDLNDPIPGETESWNDVFPTIYNFPFTAVRLK